MNKDKKNIRNEIINNRKINKEFFYGKKFHPSLITKLKFLKIFNLAYPNFNNEFLLEEIFWDNYKFVIKLSSIVTSEYIDINLNNNYGNHICKGMYCSKSICIGIHNKISDINLKKFLIYLQKNFSDKINFEYLLGILCEDYKAKKDYYKIFWESEVPNFSIINNWGKFVHKIRFILKEHIVRDLDHSLVFNIPEIFIHHSERECLGVSPINDKTRNIYRFLNYRNDFFDSEIDKYFYLSDKEKYELNISNTSYRLAEFTDLDEEDIIMGKSNDKLIKIIENTKQIVKTKKLKLVGFNCSCIPVMIGDDINSILSKAEDELKVPFIYQGYIEKTPFELRVDILFQYLNEIDKKTIIQEDNTIIFFGYHPGEYLANLASVLKDYGINIVGIFIPMIDIKLLPFLYRAELFIFSGNKYFEEIFNHPFKLIPKKRKIELRQPFGIKNTSYWLNRITEEFGVKYLENSSTSKIIKEYLGISKIIKDKKYRVGIVFIGLHDIKDFFKMDYADNLDIIEFLEEMGFGIDFFVYDNKYNYVLKYDQRNWNKNTILEEIKTKLKSPDYNVHFFSDEIDMKEKIIDSNINLIYSDIYFDKRVIELGLTQFNIKDFNIGYIGALNTIKQLKKLCEITYFKKFNKYF